MVMLDTSEHPVICLGGGDAVVVPASPPYFVGA
jgi:hypothetical protein